MNKLYLYIISVCLLILAVGMVFIGFKVARLKTSANASNDTTIVINHYYDTTVYKVQNITYKQSESFYYKDYDTNLIIGACDSVRKYDVTAESDTIRICGVIYTQGLLLSHELDYRWKLPQTEIIKTITQNQRGALVGASVYYPVDIGLNAGWIDRNGNIYLAGGTINKGFNFTYSKVLKVR